MKNNQDNVGMGLILGPVVGILISLVFHMSLFLCLLFCMAGGVVVDLLFDT